MPVWNGAWSATEATAYLEDATVPLRLACRRPDGGLWMLSLWYLYREGTFRCATGADADVVTYLEEDPNVAFEVSVNDPPYRGVRGAGSVTMKPDTDKTLLCDLFERYLGGTDNSLGERLLDEKREEVQIHIEPKRLYTWDFTDRMADAVSNGDDE